MAIWPAISAQVEVGVPVAGGTGWSPRNGRILQCRNQLVFPPVFGLFIEGLFPPYPLSVSVSVCNCLSFLLDLSGQFVCDRGSRQVQNCPDTIMTTKEFMQKVRRKVTRLEDVVSRECGVAENIQQTASVRADLELFIESEHARAQGKEL